MRAESESVMNIRLSSVLPRRFLRVGVVLLAGSVLLGTTTPGHASDAAEESTERCGGHPHEQGCMVMDFHVVGEIDPGDDPMSYGFQAGFGAFVMRDLAVTGYLGPIWDPKSGQSSEAMVDYGVRTRYLWDLDEKVALSFSYRLGGATVTSVPGDLTLFRHGPELSFVASPRPHGMVYAFIGGIFSHNNGNTDAAISVIPTLAYSF